MDKNRWLISDRGKKEKKRGGERQNEDRQTKELLRPLLQ
jgi:hypothetical protein